MTTTQKTYSLTSKPQLVDLNGDSINFDLSFSATSTNGEDFEAVVVDQAMLDSDNNPQFLKTEKGTLSANIVSDSGTYQSYYLMLKSETPCQVLVTINKEEKPVETKSVPPPVSPQETKQVGTGKPQGKPAGRKQGSGGWLKPVMMIAGVVAVGFVAYYFLVHKKKGDVVGLLPTATKPPPAAPILGATNPFATKPSMAPSPIAAPTVSSLSIGTKTINEGLLSKLNKLVPPTK